MEDRGRNKMKIPDITKFEKIARHNYRTKRAKKRQISRLKKAYHKLSTRHKCWVANMTLSAPMSEKELWIARIRLLAQSMETFSRIKDIPVVKPYEGTE